LVVFFFLNRVSLNSSGWTGTHYVAQPGLQTLLPPPECWDYKCEWTTMPGHFKDLHAFLRHCVTIMTFSWQQDLPFSSKSIADSNVHLCNPISSITSDLIKDGLLSKPGQSDLFSSRQKKKKKQSFSSDNSCGVAA
jgi:hypothetical protein